MDKILYDWDGGYYITEPKKTLAECKEILKQAGEMSDIEIDEFVDVKPCWIHWGFICNDDGERDSGWSIEWENPNNRHWKEVTYLVTQEEKEIDERQNEKNQSNI